MSNRILNMAWKARTGSAGSKIVLARLADRADEEGLCWPSQESLAEETELSISTVRRSIKDLESGGHLSIVRKFHRAPSGWAKNGYFIHPKLESTPVTLTPVNGSTPVTLIGVEESTPVTLTPVNGSTPVTLTSTPVTLTTDTGHGDRLTSIEPPIEPSSSSTRKRGADAPRVEEEETPPLDHGVIRQVEDVWALWPKRINEVAAKLAIAEAIRRDGSKVLSGTAAVVASDQARNGSVRPPGRFLPDPVAFFSSSRYLDDPAQYGPRSLPALDPIEKRKRLATLQAMLSEHPGNPGNSIGSMERKERCRPDYDRLLEDYQALRREVATEDRRIDEDQ